MTNSKDWHQAKIVAALKARGTNLSQLSRESGLSAGTLRNALYRSYPRAEAIISQAIGVPAEEIWRSRYEKR